MVQGCGGAVAPSGDCRVLPPPVPLELGCADAGAEGWGEDAGAVRFSVTLGAAAGASLVCVLTGGVYELEPLAAVVCELL